MQNLAPSSWMPDLSLPSVFVLLRDASSNYYAAIISSAAYDVCDDRKKFWVKSKTLNQVATVSLADWSCYPHTRTNSKSSSQPSKKVVARVYPLGDMRLENVLKKLHGGRCARIRTYRDNV
jgi:hypothetical protein